VVIVATDLSEPQMRPEICGKIKEETRSQKSQGGTQANTEAEKSRKDNHNFTHRGPSTL
jgi:hypothetical protein